VLLLEQALECIAVGASPADSRVDGDALRERALLDRLQQRHADGAGGRQRRLERQVARHPREECRHDRRAFGTRQSDRGLERAL